MRNARLAHRPAVEHVRKRGEPIGKSQDFAGALAQVRSVDRRRAASKPRALTLETVREKSS
jgi:hypothetical protein